MNIVCIHIIEDLRYSDNSSCEANSAWKPAHICHPKHWHKSDADKIGIYGGTLAVRYSGDLPEFDQPLSEHDIDALKRVWAEIRKRIDEQCRYISVLDQIGDSEPDPAYSPIVSPLFTGALITEIHWN